MFAFASLRSVALASLRPLVMAFPRIREGYGGQGGRGSGLRRRRFRGGGGISVLGQRSDDRGCGFRWKHSRIVTMANRNRRDGWPLIEGQYETRSARLAGNAIAAESFCGIFLTTRFHCPHCGGVLPEFTFPRITLGNSPGGRACCAAQSVSWRERHCIHGIGICLEYSDSARARDQPAHHERNESAAEARSTNIPELGM
jgi:hypothetical protein